MQESYYRAEVIAVTSSERVIDSHVLPRQEVHLRVQTGGTPFQIEILHEGDPVSGDYRPVKTGEQLVVLRTDDGQSAVYSIFDVDRTGFLFIFVAAFVLLTVAVGRKKGLLALLGSALGIFVLLAYVVPRILAGDAPLLVALFGACAIACSSMLLAHGFNRRTYVALASTILTLVFVTVLAWLAVEAARLTGMGDENAFFLRFGPLGSLNLQGLLLAGIIIGSMGALDDVTTAQSAVVFELRAANHRFGFSELVRRASAVGYEHIASLVNTLLLAYVGASFPLFLLLTLPSSMPFWVIFNTEFIAQEVVRTLVGSAGIICAVPFTTFFAAWIASRYPPESLDGTEESVL